MTLENNASPLADTRIQQIIAEEQCRIAVRKELEGSKPNLGFWGKVFRFLDGSKIGFGLASAVGVILLSGISPWINNKINAESIAAQKEDVKIQKETLKEQVRVNRQREGAEQNRRNLDMFFKLIPSLFSGDNKQSNVAGLLLTSMKEQELIETSLHAKISVVLDGQAVDGAIANEKSVQRSTANLVAKAEDKLARNSTSAVIADELKAPKSTTTKSPLLMNLGELPIRIYIQVAIDSQKTIAEKLRVGFVEAKMLSPDIEVVGEKAPKVTGIRYCDGKVEEGAPISVQKVVDSQLRLKGTPLLELPSRLCGKVRFNHFEVWFNKAQN